MCFVTVETARLMDDCICRGGFAVVIFAGFNFCWIQLLLDSNFAGFMFCWIQGLLDSTFAEFEFLLESTFAELVYSNFIQLLVWLEIKHSMGALSWWCSIFANLHVKSLPLDLADAIDSFPNLLDECVDCLGIIVVCLALKLPVVRRCFMDHWHEAGKPKCAQGVFSILRQVALSFSNKPPVSDIQQIGGPSYAHGWQILLSQMCVVGEGGRGPDVYLGIGRKHMRLQPFGSDADMFVQGYLNLHPLLFSIIHGEGPRTLQEWRNHSASLHEAFTFWQIPGMRGGGNGYCSQWIVRTFLVATMRWKGLEALELDEDDKVRDLCGPDENGSLTVLEKVTKSKYAQGCLRGLKYNGPPELLAMWACLLGSEKDKKVKKMKCKRKRTTETDDVCGPVFFLQRTQVSNLEHLH